MSPKKDNKIIKMMKIKAVVIWNISNNSLKIIENNNEAMNPRYKPT